MWWWFAGCAPEAASPTSTATPVDDTAAVAPYVYALSRDGETAYDPESDPEPFALAFATTFGIGFRAQTWARVSGPAEGAATALTLRDAAGDVELTLNVQIGTAWSAATLDLPDDGDPPCGAGTLALAVLAPDPGGFAPVAVAQQFTDAAGASLCP